MSKLIFLLALMLCSLSYAESTDTPENIMVRAIHLLASEADEENTENLKAMLFSQEVFDVLRMPGDARHTSGLMVHPAKIDDAHRQWYVELYSFYGMLLNHEELSELAALWFVDDRRLIIKMHHPFKESAIRCIKTPDRDLLACIRDRMLNHVDNPYYKDPRVAATAHMLQSQALVEYSTLESLNLWAENNPPPFFFCTDYLQLAKNRDKAEVVLFILNHYVSYANDYNASWFRNRLASVLFDTLFRFDYYDFTSGETRCPLAIPTSEPMRMEICTALDRVLTVISLTDDLNNNDNFSAYQKLLCTDGKTSDLPIDFAVVQDELKLPEVDSKEEAQRLLPRGGVSGLAAICYISSHPDLFSDNGIPAIRRAISDSDLLGNLQGMRASVRNGSFGDAYPGIHTLLTSLSSSPNESYGILLIDLLDNDFFQRPSTYPTRSHYVVLSYLRNLRHPTNELAKRFDELLSAGKFGFFDRVELFSACLEYGQEEFLQILRKHHGYSILPIEMIAAHRSNWRVVKMVLEDYVKGQAFRTEARLSLPQMLLSPTYTGIDYRKVEMVQFTPAPVTRPPEPREAKAFESFIRGLLTVDAEQVSEDDRQQFKKMLELIKEPVDQ